MTGFLTFQVINQIFSRVVGEKLQALPGRLLHKLQLKHTAILYLVHSFPIA